MGNTNLWWTAMGALAAIASILVVAAPRRWLGRAMLLWVASPIPAYVGVVTWEMTTRPSDKFSIATAFYGFVLISPVLLVPWLLICLAGFAVGLGLRRLVRPVRGRMVTPPPATAQTASTAPVASRAAASTPVRPGDPGDAVEPCWRAVHIGFENDGLRICTVSIWEQKWRSTGAPPLHLPHPAHPNETHRFTIHSAGDEGRPIRFAVAELSNSIWGFYIPVVHSVASHDVASAEGVPHYGDRPLRSHGHSAAQAGHAAPAQGCAPIDCWVSPDGALRVDLAAAEWANSHWVNSPRVVDIAGRRTVLDFWGTDWDAAVSFPGPGRVGLAFQRYGRQGSLAAELDVGQGTYQIVSEPGHEGARPPAPLSEAANGLEAASGRADAFVAREGGMASPPHAGPHPLAAWRSALVILAGAAVAIAVGSIMLQPTGRSGHRQLTPFPAMPQFAPYPPLSNRQ